MKIITSLLVLPIRLRGNYLTHLKNFLYVVVVDLSSAFCCLFLNAFENRIMAYNNVVVFWYRMKTNIVGMESNMEGLLEKVRGILLYLYLVGKEEWSKDYIHVAFGCR